MSPTQLLLEFLLNLLRDPKAAEEFQNDPQGVLDAHGLGDIGIDDVDAVVPVILDYAPVSAIGDRVFGSGGHGVGGGDTQYGGPAAAPVVDAGAVHTPVVAQLTHVVNNFSYTSVDDRDAFTDQSVNQNIWALGDVTQLFDAESVGALGGTVAADAAVLGASEGQSTGFDFGHDLDAVEVDDALDDESGNPAASVSGSPEADESLDGPLDADVSVDGSPVTDVSVDGSPDTGVAVDGSLDVSVGGSLDAVATVDHSVSEDESLDGSADAEDPFEDAVDTDDSVGASTIDSYVTGGSVDTADLDSGDDPVDADDAFSTEDPFDAGALFPAPPAEVEAENTPEEPMA